MHKRVYTVNKIFTKWLLRWNCKPKGILNLINQLLVPNEIASEQLFECSFVDIVLIEVRVGA